MKVWKHGCDITRFLIGSVFSDVRFDWLVGNMSVYQENLFQSRIFLHLSNYLLEIFYKSNRGLLSVFPWPHLNTRGSWENSRRLCKPETQVCITVSNSPNTPSCLDEAMETQKTPSIA